MVTLISEGTNIERTYLFDPSSVPDLNTRDAIENLFKTEDGALLLEDIDPETPETEGPDFLTGDWCVMPKNLDYEPVRICKLVRAVQY
jgi:hypothetical protein